MKLTNKNQPHQILQITAVISSIKDRAKEADLEKMREAFNLADRMLWEYYLFFKHQVEAEKKRQQQ